MDERHAVGEPDHVASIETDDGSNPLGKTAAFPEFQRELRDRCSEQPAAQDATLVGSYRFFADSFSV